MQQDLHDIARRTVLRRKTTVLHRKTTVPRKKKTVDYRETAVVCSKTTNAT